VHLITSDMNVLPTRAVETKTKYKGTIRTIYVTAIICSILGFFFQVDVEAQ
jgi:hypothetical protein